MTVARTRGWKPVLAAAGAAIVVGAMGALVTDLGAWYYALRKPVWQPPDWLFGPAWTLIFGMCAIAGVLAWRHAPDHRVLRLVLALFAANIVLNILWSVLFFRLQRPDWALLEVAFLWLSILLLILVLARFSRVAAWLLAPYLAWVSFASLLNFAIVRLNAPFGSG